MKKIAIFTCIIVMVLTLKSQEEIRTFRYLKNGSIVEIPISDVDSIIFSKYSVPNNSTGVLINDVVWATCNVDAPGTFASAPSEPGMFYQWNRRVGWSSTDPLVNHGGGGAWNSSLPTGTTWSKANDPCPAGWRVPNHSEQESLLSSGSFWGDLNGVYGRYFGNGADRVFFPAAGVRVSDDGSLVNVNLGGYYWSRTKTEVGSVFIMILFSGSTATNISYLPSMGLTVRCVAE
jgi:uncharacterized protein (TIGR02145 family)